MWKQERYSNKVNTEKRTRFQKGYVCWTAVKYVFVELRSDSVTILTHTGTALCVGMTLCQHYASGLMRTRRSMPLQVCCCCCVCKNLSHYSGIQNNVGSELPIDCLCGFDHHAFV